MNDNLLLAEILLLSFTLLLLLHLLSIAGFTDVHRRKLQPGLGDRLSAPERGG